MTPELTAAGIALCGVMLLIAGWRAETETRREECDDASALPAEDL